MKVKVNGTIKNATVQYVKINGAIKTVIGCYIKRNGQWQLVN